MNRSTQLGLHQRRRKAWGELKDIVNRATAENRALTYAERVRWDALMRVLDMPPNSRPVLPLPPNGIVLKFRIDGESEL